MDAHYVAFPQERFEVDLESIGEGAGYRVGEHDPRAEGGKPARDRRADVAHADDADGHRAQLVAHGLEATKRILGVPVAGAELAVQPERAADQGDHRHHRPVGDGFLVVAGRVGDRDAVLRGGAVVDRIESDRGLLDEQASPHLLQDFTVDLVLVPPVRDHEVGAGAGGRHLGLSRRRWHEHDLHPVAVREHAAHRAFVIRAEARNAGLHRSRRLAFSR